MGNEFIINNGVLKKYNGQGGEVTIPEGVIDIGDGAFSWCSSLKKVTIPENPQAKTENQPSRP